MPPLFDPDTTNVRMKLTRFGLLIAGVFSVTVWGVNKLNAIDAKLASIEKATALAWSIQDEERRSNWLLYDNRSLGLVVRDTSQVVKARNP